jgi:hypothetical protein
VTALDERAPDKLESLLFDQRPEGALLSKPAVKSATKSRAAVPHQSRLQSGRLPRSALACADVGLDRDVR